MYESRVNRIVRNITFSIFFSFVEIISSFSLSVVEENLPLVSEFELQNRLPIKSISCLLRPVAFGLLLQSRPFWVSFFPRLGES